MTCSSIGGARVHARGVVRKRGHLGFVLAEDLALLRDQERDRADAELLAARLEGDATILNLGDAARLPTPPPHRPHPQMGRRFHRPPCSNSCWRGVRLRFSGGGNSLAPLGMLDGQSPVMYDITTQEMTPRSADHAPGAFVSDWDYFAIQYSASAEYSFFVI
jgi:hypothetical protein